jgi:UDP-4-amino-4,6-dideoxy-N-acetyl-beta-L-altrosamine N-acetyltransferase
MLKDYDFGFARAVNYTNLPSEEVEQIRAWRNHPEINCWMYNAHEITVDEHQEFVSELKTRKDALYWLVKKDNDMVGSINLTKINHGLKLAYLGLFSNPESKLHGKGNILMGVLFNIAFKEEGLETLQLEVFESNERAINFYLKHGFEEQAKLLGYVSVNGRREDVIVMAISAEKALKDLESMELGK